MYLKGDPDMHLKGVIKKFGLEEFENDIINWLDSEPSSPAAWKKYWIMRFYTVGNPDQHGDVDGDYYHPEYHDIDLKDPTTWGERDPHVAMPTDDFFVKLHQAAVKDQKRRNKRSSWEY